MNGYAMLALLSALSLSVGGCDKKEASASDNKPTKSDKSDKGEPKAKSTGSTIKLTKLHNLRIAAGEAEVADGIGGKGVSLTSAEIGVLSIEEAGENDPKTLKAAQEESSMFNPKNVKTETLTDGWTMTFENTGSAGTNYWVVARREIAGTAYRCQSTLTTPTQQAGALAACKSLEP